LANGLERSIENVQTASGQFTALQICQTVSGKSPDERLRPEPFGKSAAPIYETPSRKSQIDLALYLEDLCRAFPLSWSHYVRLLTVENPEARKFYAV
jgi:hypothetical protein